MLILLQITVKSFWQIGFKWPRVETVEGLRDLYIPSGIQPGETVKLPRMGVPDISKPSIRGDHHFTVNVLIPKKIRF